MKFNFKKLLILYEFDIWSKGSLNYDIKKTDKEILDKLKGDKSNFTKIFIKNNIQYFEDKKKKEFILNYVDNFTLDILNELKQTHPKLNDIKYEHKKKLYDYIKYNVLENSVWLLKDLNYETSSYDSIVSINEISNITKTIIINIFKINQKLIQDYNVNNVSLDNLFNDLIKNINYNEDDINNYNNFIKSNSNSKNIDKHKIFNELRRWTKDKDIIDYSISISNKYANILQSEYLDFENFSIINIAQKLSPDEVIALIMIFSWQEDEVKEIEWSNLNKFLSDIWKKIKDFNLNIADNNDIISNFKKTIIKLNFPFTKELFKNTKNVNKSYEAFLNISTYLNYYNIDDFIDIIKNSNSHDIDNFFKTNISISKDNNEFIKNFNIFFEDYGIKKTKKDIETIKEEKELQISSILRWIKNINVDDAVKKLSELSWIKIDNTLNELSFDVKMKSIFANIDKILKEYSISKDDNIVTFLQTYFVKEWVYDYFLIEENKNKKSKENSYKKENSYNKFINWFIKIISDQIKIDNLKNLYEIANSNDDFNKIVDKFFDKISNKELLVKKNQDTKQWIISNKEDNKKWFKLNNKDIKKWLKVNLKISLIEFMEKKWVYEINKKFLIENKDELFKKLIDDNKSLDWNQEVVEWIFNDFIYTFKDELRFDKNQVNQFKEKFNKNYKFIEESEKFQKLWYNWYLEEKEKEKEEKKFDEINLLDDKTNILYENSVFTSQNSQDLAIHFNYENWIYEFQLKLPWKKDIIKVYSLSPEKWNKEVINEYLHNLFGLNIILKWNWDLLNKIVSYWTDISKEWLKIEDFDNINSFFQTYIYENFFKNPTKEEKKIINKYDLNTYNMYTTPWEFAKKFAKMINETSNTNILGMKYDQWKFFLDLQDIKNKNIFDKNYQKNIKEIVSDNWKNYYT